MAMSVEEGKLHDDAKKALLTLLLKNIEEDQPASYLLNIAETYAIVAGRSPSGRINAPKS